MKLSVLTMSVASLCALSACRETEVAASNEGAMANVEAASTAAAANAATPSGEQGSGTYAADCAKPDDRYVIALTKGGDGMVSASVDHDGKSYADVLTSYSYMGKETPNDFLIAVLFDEGNSPVPAADDGSRIEIWKGEAAYYALVNGDKAQRLTYCG